MARSRSTRRDSTRSSGRVGMEEEMLNSSATKLGARRIATVYDAVAGRVGLNGFLTQDQIIAANSLPSLPEEVLLRRVNAPDEIPYNYYNADEQLKQDQKLPDSDLLKAAHAYTSAFFAAVTTENGPKEFRAFDETALLALGILLEEATKEALGDTGDMALVEAERLDSGLSESRRTQHQVIGRVSPREVQRMKVQFEETDVTNAEESPRKRRRAQT